MANNKRNRGLYKRGKVWWCDFTVSGERFQKSLGTTMWNEALARRKELEAEAHQGKLTPKAQAFGTRLRFPDAAEQYLAKRMAHPEKASLLGSRKEKFKRR